LKRLLTIHATKSDKSP